MSIKVKVTEEEIQNNSNNYDLGQLVRNKYWEIIGDEITTKIDNIDTSINIKSNDLNSSVNTPEYDRCIDCGKNTPYTKDTHIDKRRGYIEGMGQTCFQKNICG